MNVKKKVNGAINGTLDKVYKLIDKAPTTNLRIIVTLLLVIGTAIRYWAAGGGPTAWSPDWDWLMFLAAMSGLDVVQHWAKRKTAWSPTEQANAAVIRNGHEEVESTISAGEEEVG